MRKRLTFCICVAFCMAGHIMDSPEANPPKGCVLVHTYKEGPGAKDWSGNGNDGIPNAGTFWAGTNGIIGGGYFLNGLGGDLRATHNGMDKDVGTVSIWFNSNLSSVSATAFYFFDSDGARHAFLFGGAAGKKHIQMYNDGRQTDFVVAWGVGEWHHIVFLYAKTGNVQKLYFDGVEVGPFSAAGTWGANNLGVYIHIGARFTSANTFAGRLEGVQIYNHLLSSIEIKDLYQKGVAQ